MSAIVNLKCATSYFLKISNYSFFDLSDDTIIPRIKINWGKIAGLVPMGMKPIEKEYTAMVLPVYRDTDIYAHAVYDTIDQKWIHSKILTVPTGEDLINSPPLKDTYHFQYYYKHIGTVLLKAGNIDKILTQIGNIDFNLKPIQKEFPLQIIDATEEPGKPRIRIKWGTIANLHPEGFEIGDFPGYYLNLNESSFVYACAKLDPGKMIWEKSWIEISTVSLYSTPVISYKLIGSVQVFEGKIVSITNPLYNDVTMGLQDLYLNEQ